MDPEGRPPRRDPEGEAEDGALGLLSPYVTDPTLWPVLIVAMLSASVLLAWVLVLAVGDRNLFALAALGLLLVLSGDGIRQDLRRRAHRGLGTGLILTLWLLAAAVAWASRAQGLF